MERVREHSKNLVLADLERRMLSYMQAMKKSFYKKMNHVVQQSMDLDEAVGSESIKIARRNLVITY